MPVIRIVSFIINNSAKYYTFIQYKNKISIGFAQPLHDLCLRNWANDMSKALIHNTFCPKSIILSFFDIYFLIFMIKSFFLLEKDFITKTDTTYRVYDRFFQLWLEKGTS